MVYGGIFCFPFGVPRRDSDKNSRPGRRGRLGWSLRSGDRPIADLTSPEHRCAQATRHQQILMKPGKHTLFLWCCNQTLLELLGGIQNRGGFGVFEVGGNSSFETLNKKQKLFLHLRHNKSSWGWCVERSCTSFRLVTWQERCGVLANTAEVNTCRISAASNCSALSCSAGPKQSLKVFLRISRTFCVHFNWGGTYEQFLQLRNFLLGVNCWSLDCFEMIRKDSWICWACAFPWWEGDLAFPTWACPTRRWRRFLRSDAVGWSRQRSLEVRRADEQQQRSEHHPRASPSWNKTCLSEPVTWFNHLCSKCLFAVRSFSLSAAWRVDGVLLPSKLKNVSVWG